MPKSRTIRVLVLGDSGVGKTTFISTLFSEMNYASEKMLQPVLLPPNMCLIASTDVYTELIDTQTSRTNLSQSVNKCDIILLMYDVTEPETVDRLASYWLRIINGINNRVPVVVVGNKRDKIQKNVRDTPDYRPIRDVTRPLVRQYHQVQIGLECSAYYDQNVDNVLHYIQLTSLFPLSPLYNVPEKDLTPTFKKILMRVFRVLDEDMDGQLSDQEFSRLQSRVFGGQLNNEEIKKIKDIISMDMECYNMHNINLDGFLSLNRRCIEMKNMQICWNILHNFGYDDDLQVLPVANQLIFKEGVGSSIELKEKPKNFLFKLFKHFEQRHRSDINSKELIAEIFMPVDEIPIYQFQDVDRVISLENFMVAWSYFANRNYIKCYETLQGIGYEGDLDETFDVRPPKLSMKDMRKIQERSLIYVAMLDSGGDEAYYVDGFFQHPVVEHGIQRCYYICSLKEGSKILVLYRLKAEDIDRFFENYPKRLLDIVVYFERGWSNLEKLAQLRKFPEKIMRKKITQAEVDEGREIRDQSQSQFSPITKSRRGSMQHISQVIWNVIEHPEMGYTPETVRELEKLNKSAWMEPPIIAAFGAIVLAGGVFLAKYLSKTRS